MGGALAGCEIFRFIKQPEIAFFLDNLAGVVRLNHLNRRFQVRRLAGYLKV